MKNTKLIQAIGQITLILGFLGYAINHFWLNNLLIITIACAVMFGISVFFNIAYLKAMKKERDQKKLPNSQSDE